MKYNMPKYIRYLNIGKFLGIDGSGSGQYEIVSRGTSERRADNAVRASLYALRKRNRNTPTGTKVSNSEGVTIMSSLLGIQLG